MTAVVIDASVAIKWVVEEPGTDAALTIKRESILVAPDLLVSECANILWKKTRRNELTRKEADLACRLLEGAPIELVPTRLLLRATTRLAVALDHPAYDCVYLALARERRCRFVTADERLLRKIETTPVPGLRRHVRPLLSKLSPS